MELKNIILIVIAVLIILMVGIGLYVLDNGTSTDNITAGLANITQKDTNNTTAVNKTNDTNITNATNKTVGDNSPRVNETANSTNATYKVYNPQTDSYVPVIGEKYDDEVNRWYTYDSDGVRYYNTRIH